MRWWIKLIGGLLAVAVLLWLIASIGRFGLDILSLRGDDGARDPQFAEPAEAITAPPELYGPEGESTFRDNSANWDTSVQTPVDQTAGELGEEARRAASD